VNGAYVKLFLTNEITHEKLKDVDQIFVCFEITQLVKATHIKNPVVKVFNLKKTMMRLFMKIWLSRQVLVTQEMNKFITALLINN